MGLPVLRRILTILDETPCSESARQYALQLASVHRAEIAAVAGIDLLPTAVPMLGGIGSAAYQARLDDALGREAEAVRYRLHAAFVTECSAQGMPFEWLSFDGDLPTALLSAVEVRDLVVTGNDARIHGNLHKRICERIKKLVLMAPRPIIVCPQGASVPGQIMVAYDGSVPAMRKVQLFTLLQEGLRQEGMEKPLCVVSIGTNAELVTRRTRAVASFLRSHGHEADPEPIVSHHSPAEVLNAEVKARKIGTLVMGAFGHRGYRELLFGSTTGLLLEKPPCALFVYH